MQHASFAGSVLPTIAVALCVYATSPMAEDTPVDPSPDDLSRFVNHYSGESRPDLVPFWSKIEQALASVNGIDSVLSNTDRALIDDYESEILQSFPAEDGRLIDRMREELCGRIDGLDGVTIAAGMMRIDQALLAQRDARANELVRSLSTSAAEALLAEAERVAKLFSGSSTDAYALAKEFPEYVKERYRAHCVALGHIGSSNGNE